MAWQQSGFKSDWKLLAQNEKMSKKKTPNLKILQEELKKVWCQEMSMEYLINLSDSMPKRLQIVIQIRATWPNIQKCHYC